MVKEEIKNLLDIVAINITLIECLNVKVSYTEHTNVFLIEAETDSDHLLANFSLPVFIVKMKKSYVILKSWDEKELDYTIKGNIDNIEELEKEMQFHLNEALKVLRD